MGQISAIHISEEWEVKIWNLVAIFGSDFYNPYFRKMGGENMEHGAIFGSDFHKSAMNSWQEGWSSGGTTNRVSL